MILDSQVPDPRAKVSGAARVTSDQECIGRSAIRADASEQEHGAGAHADKV